MTEPRRLVFGEDRLPSDEALAAPGWRPDTEAGREARFARELAAWGKRSVCRCGCAACEPLGPHELHGHG